MVSFSHFFFLRSLLFTLHFVESHVNVVALYCSDATENIKKKTMEKETKQNTER